MLLLNPPTLHGTRSVQDIIQYLPLVSIWVAYTPPPPVGEPLGQIQDKYRCDSQLGRFVTIHLRTFSLLSSYNSPSLGCFNYGIITWMIKEKVWCSHPLAKVWWREGGGSIWIGSIPWYCGQQLHFGGQIPPHSSLSVVHRSGMPLWTGLWKSSVVLPVGKDPGPAGGCQMLIGFLGLEGLLS